MPFPTSGLVNNQVHTESGQNRSWVYDSTLAVWNQLREAPDTISILGADTGLGNVVLNGSSTVFPTGHIIQVSADTTGVTSTDINVGNNTFTDTVVTAAFTPTVSGSDVIVSCFWNMYVNNTSGDAGWVVRFKRAIADGATTYPTSLSGIGVDATAGYASGYYGYTGEHREMQSAVLIDSPSTDQAITYTLQCAEYNAETIRCGSGYVPSARWHIWFMEVSR